MPEKILTICDRIVQYSFYLLLFFTPLILTPLNYELFEYNKMVLTYSFTIIIVGAWVLKMIINRRLFVRRTPLDIPLLLFLLSQFLSYFFSLDRHLSFWGYYSRFHGGLASTISYFLLYYAAVSNLNRERILTGLRLGLLSGALVAVYGVAEHFGIDAQFWVQDVKNRVFSTLGQPNWLAAYLSILIPIAMALGMINSKFEARNPKQIQNPNFPNLKRFAHLNFGHLDLFRISIFGFTAFLFYLCLLYTKSRSGFLGFWVGMGVLGVFVALMRARVTRANILEARGGGRGGPPSSARSVARTSDGGEARQDPERILRPFLIFVFTFLVLTFLVGSPFGQINKYLTLAGLREKFTHVALPPSSPPPPGGTESGEIRKIVWKGAVDVWRHYPLFGSGVETFAFSYYQYRPIEHNLVSEWDFLYNKAHNEYLNFLATTGAFGLGSYLLVIGWFVVWFIRKFTIYNLQFTNKKNKNSTLYIVNYALLAGYASILVSNFFGFSVVVVALFFFLIPAFSFVLSGAISDEEAWTFNWNRGGKTSGISFFQSLLIGAVILVGSYFLVTIGRFWLADVYFARGYNFNRIEDYYWAYSSLKQATETNPSEPLYRDELSYTAALLAIEAFQENEATQAALLIQEAIGENQKALEISPQNVNFWKTKTRIFYLLSSLDDQYNQEALEAIKRAYELAPTDAKVAYNVGILYGRVGDTQKAIETFKKTVELKPDYRDAHYALALYLKNEGKNEEAAEHLKYILEKISPEDEQIKEMLKEWEQ